MHLKRNKPVHRLNPVLSCSSRSQPNAVLDRLLNWHTVPVNVVVFGDPELDESSVCGLDPAALHEPFLLHPAQLQETP